MRQRRLMPTGPGEALHQENMSALIEGGLPGPQFGKPDGAVVIGDGQGADGFLPDLRFDEAGNALALDHQPGREFGTRARVEAAEQGARRLDVEITLFE